MKPVRFFGQNDDDYCMDVKTKADDQQLYEWLKGSAWQGEVGSWTGFRWSPSPPMDPARKKMLDVIELIKPKTIGELLMWGRLIYKGGK